MTQIYIIAEAGVNHNGDPDLAFQLVDAAVAAGADAVKFQTFNSELLVTKTAPKANYQKKTTSSGESQFEMLKKLELDRSVYFELVNYCQKQGIVFLSTAFDVGSLQFLVDDLELTTLKIPSGEITNGPLLLAHAQTGLNLIISTGMATLGEIEVALGVVAFGYANDKNTKITSRKDFQEAYFSSRGQELLKNKVTLLHCTTEYPAPYEDINLKAMASMKSAFGLKTGYSDHSQGITVPIAAATLGAVIIEKHFTLDNTLQGPDHKASLEPDELKEMVQSIRVVEKILGEGGKVPSPVELKNRECARKSIIAGLEIKPGDVFSKNNLLIKRAGSGITPMRYWELLGTVSKDNYKEDELIC